MVFTFSTISFLKIVGLAWRGIFLSSPLRVKSYESNTEKQNLPMMTSSISAAAQMSSGGVVVATSSSDLSN